MRTGSVGTSGHPREGRSRSFGHDHGALAPVVGGCPRNEVFFNFGCPFCQSTNPGRRHPDDPCWTTLFKPDGGVRGIVAGDVIRSLVEHAGCECVEQALQGLTQLHPDTTMTSIDWISAFDLISRESMLTWLTRVEGGQAALPFVRFILRVTVRIFVGGRCRDSPQDPSRRGW